MMLLSSHRDAVNGWQARQGTASNVPAPQAAAAAQQAHYWRQRLALPSSSLRQSELETVHITDVWCAKYHHKRNGFDWYFSYDLISLSSQLLVFLISMCYKIMKNGTKKDPKKPKECLQRATRYTVAFFPPPPDALTKRMIHLASNLEFKLSFFSTSVCKL